jgi:DNA-binding MarR family transcriptional regulator
MADERQATIFEITEAYRDISRALWRSTASVWTELDLSMAQLKTLVILHNTAALTIGQVAEALCVGLPTASHLVDRLVQAQLAVRAEDPDDRRRTLAYLAPQGKELAERLHQGSRDQLRRWLALLDDATLAELLPGLRALGRAASTETA